MDVRSLDDTNGYAPALAQPQSAGWNSSNDGAAWEPESSLASNHVSTYVNGLADRSVQQGHESSIAHALPAFRTGCTGDNYLGVSSADSVLSPIKGTSLSLFGMEIDLADFVPSDWDEASSPRSYHQFLALAFNKYPKTHKAELPDTYAECENYATWFFRFINPYAPVLHKPDFMALVSRMVRACCSHLGMLIAL